MQFLRLSEAFDRPRHWWVQPLCVLITVASLMGSWYLATFIPSRHPPPFTIVLPVSFFTGFVLVYGLPWFIRFCPSEVRFFDSRLARSRRNTQLQIKYQDIASFSWRFGDEFATLILKTRKPNRLLLLGVPLEISQEAVTQFLLGHGVPPDTNEQQP